MTPRAVVIWITFALPGRAVAQNVSEVQVAPPTVTVKVGERSGLLATLFDRAGNVIPTVRFIWSSNNVSIAKVDNDGTVPDGWPANGSTPVASAGRAVVCGRPLVCVPAGGAPSTVPAAAPARAPPRAS